MIYYRLLLIAIPLLLQSFNLQHSSLPQAKPKWVSLFNGVSLENWTPKIAGFRPGQNYGTTFRVAEGILSTRYDQYDSFNNKFGDEVDNRWIVPYNPYLSVRYNAHINVEICASVKSVKYLYKYVYKGHDKAMIVIQKDGQEIKKYDEV